MRLLVFGLSISSSWGNGHATVYRGLSRALARRGMEVTFVEKDVPWYASNRDLWECDYASVVLYRDQWTLEDLLPSALRRADAVMVGSFFPDAIPLIERLSRVRTVPLLFYDIDTPVTLGNLAAAGATEYLRADQIPLFDAVLSFTGGPALRELRARWGAKRAEALYCGLDRETHARVSPDERYRCRLGYMGTYSPDRIKAMERLFLEPARESSADRFVLAGPQYPDDLELPDNVSHFQHVPPPDHSRFYSSCDLTLNITREQMVAWGYSPSVRLFEAAGCAACTVSDAWSGLDEVFEVGKEILVVRGTAEMLDVLRGVGAAEAREIGERALARALRDHTYDARASQLLELLESL